MWDWLPGVFYGESGWCNPGRGIWGGMGKSGGVGHAAIVGDLFLDGGRRTGHWALSSSRLEVFLIFRN